MNVLVYIFIGLGTFVFMEGVAWFTHKYVMHGLLWNLHEDHHVPNHNHFLERNDFFFLIFAIPGMICLGLGTWNEWWSLFAVGAGITAYGAAYFTVHDLFIHQRLKVLRKTDNIYFRAIRKAHKVHHKNLGKEEGECFGMLWVPWKYFQEAKRTSTK